MSIPALQAQIDQVSADIQRQRELLKKLERNKSFLQRKLNDLRDPISRLPLEISSDIFIRCLPPYPGPGAHVPRLLLEICNTWTAIALSTPALWARMNFYLPRPQGFQELLKLWFQRAGGQPLCISVTGLMDDHVAAVIWENSSRLERLEFSAGEKDETESGDDEPDSDSDGIERWDIWRSVEPQPLPLLQSLFIYGREDLTLELLPFIQLLRLSPKLSELTLHDVEFDGDADEASEKLVLPNLRRLIFDYDAKDDTAGEYDILLFISAPHLQTLGLSAEGTSYSDWRITSFLWGSKPPLQELIVWDTDTDDADGLYNLLNIVPAVTRLELKYPKPSIMGDLFTRLAETPCTILPSLQTLRIPCTLGHFSVFHWEATSRMLATRRTRLRSLQLVGLPGGVRVPANVLSAFRELSAEGMEIQIGYSGRNLLSLE
ncbi:hypothetical protein FB45DRAFT_900794 [Roridomyces roridus]|uniref:F-box domain-containing protein n=1 Tax=Roridomyces roridus TaxID=1738132 RepID=A0AAD7C8E7_9AGAR|nr:hypothetical protein FB45DRAFT_900794 [Roridomyces roridus]